jgi:hypothetical protein
VQEKTRTINRLHKVLEDANIKLGSVATDILGATPAQRFTLWFWYVIIA